MCGVTDGLVDEDTATPAPDRQVLDAAVKLIRGSEDEQRVVGASIALQQASLLLTDEAGRHHLLSALDSTFVCRLLNSVGPYRRVGIGLVRALVVDSAGALALRACVAALGSIWSEGTDVVVVAGGDQSTSGSSSDDGTSREDGFDSLQALRQFTRLLDSSTAVSTLLPAVEKPLRSVTMKVESGCVVELDAALSLVQEMCRHGSTGDAAEGLLEAVCLASNLFGTAESLLATGILADVLEDGGKGKRLFDVLTVLLGNASRDSSWKCCASALRLAAAALVHDLTLLGGVQLKVLERLRALLRLASGQVRLGLEGHVPTEALCAACMFLEAATVSLGKLSDELASAGCLGTAGDCLEILRRTMQDMYDYCIDLSLDEDIPAQLELVARMISVWQIEDPLCFSSEFRRSLGVLCRLPSESFQFLLPSIQELDDWHCSPALAKVLEVMLDCMTEKDSAPFQTCALMLAEIAMDATVYLPEAPIPPAPAKGVIQCSTKSRAMTAKIVLDVLGDCDRPLVAADPSHVGVQRLSAWSVALWVAGTRASSVDRHVLALVCGSLLTSVPECAVPDCDAMRSMWSCVAEAVLQEHAEPAAAQLMTQLCGFSLDRHTACAQALAAAKMLGTHKCPVLEDTESESVCTAALRLRQFVGRIEAPSPVPCATSSDLEAMD